MFRALILTIAVAALAAAGCNASNHVDEDVDCHNICNHYRDCFDSTYDADSCHDRCLAYVRSDAGSVSRMANDCDTCLDGRSCTEGVAPCAAQCSVFIP